MFDYLYYKLYQAVLKGSLRDIPRFITPVFFATLISVNLLVINAFLAKIGIVSFLFSNKMRAATLIIAIIILTLTYYRGTKPDDILKKYEGESNAKRIRGNIIVSMYVAISFLSIFAVAFFRPGKL